MAPKLMKKNKMPTAKGEKLFEVFAVSICIIITVIAAYPLYYLVLAAFSNPFAVQNGEVMFGIVGFTPDSFIEALQIDGLWMAYGNTIFYTFFGVIISMTLTTTMAYALSKKRLLYRKFFTLMVVFTMWFNAGMLPFYVTIKGYGLLNERYTMLISFAITAYNLMVMRSFFEQIPESLEEAAFIDGASNIRIFLKIYIPLSVPALITVGMFYLVTKWNNYFWAMTLLQDDELMPLQVLLRKLIVDRTAGAEEAEIITQASTSSPLTIIYSVIIIAIVPMLLLYPFVQKYFRTGATMGAVKG